MASFLDRLDSWFNNLTGFGVAGRDKRLGATARLDLLTREELLTLWRADGLAGKIVDRLPWDMTRKGHELRIPDQLEQAQELEHQAEALGVPGAMKEGLQWGRLYGGAAAVLGVDDGQHFSRPVKLDQVRRLAFVNVLDRWSIQPGDRQNDPNQPGFGRPINYRILDGTALSRGSLIHASRVIPFHGLELPAAALQSVSSDGWGDSVLNRVFSVLQDYNSSHDALPIVIQDFIQAVYKIRDLAKMMADPTGAEAVKKRIALVDYGRSIAKAVTIDAELEEFAKLGTPVQGLPDLVDRVERRLVAVSGMPHTILFGESPGASLGESGGSQSQDWDDTVEAEQAAKLRPALRRVYELLMAAQGSPTGGEVPKGWDVVFRPLRQPTELEQATLRREQAETDAVYLERQVVFPSEVRASRFGGDRWSPETVLDPTLEASDEPIGTDPATPPPGQELEDDDQVDEDLDEEA